MDLTKIGRYIAEKRKALGMTQRQLAEQLGMSDKSVSKWERGVCLPDVAAYADLCRILGISITEFLAGEDIAQENIVRKSEENLIGITKDGKHKQRRLKAIIYALLALCALALALLAGRAYRAGRPQNYIAPLPGESIEMQTAELLAGTGGVHLYRFTTTDEYRGIRLYLSEYREGELTDREELGIGFDGMSSPKSGSILLIPDLDRFVIELVLAADGAKYTTELPVLADLDDRAGYGVLTSRIEGETEILYDVEQPLVGWIFDNDELRGADPYEMLSGQSEALAEDDYGYLLSFEFYKK